MKLEYRHIRQYSFYEDNSEKGLKVLFGSKSYMSVTHSNVEYIIQCQLKPILHSMKDLTNEFISSLDVNYEIETELKLFREIENLGELSYESTVILLDHLFDIDGLIPLGLAIDYNVIANANREF